MLMFDIPFGTTDWNDVEPTEHPRDPALLGLKNLSAEIWLADLSDGRTMELEPGQTCNLAALQQIRSPAGPIRVLR